MVVYDGPVELSTTTQDTRASGAVDAHPPNLETLYRAHSTYLVRLAMRILGREAEARDVVQDVFVTVARKLDALRDPAAARSWLATSTVRLARRRLRSRSFKQWLGLDHQPPVDVSRTSSIEERSIISNAYAHLERLPVRVRTAWILRHVEEFSLEEVAELNRCSLATAKRDLARAAEFLEEVLRD